MSRGRGKRLSKPFHGKHRKARMARFAAKHKGTKKGEQARVILDRQRGNP